MFGKCKQEAQMNPQLNSSAAPNADTPSENTAKQNTDRFLRNSSFEAEH